MIDYKTHFDAYCKENELDISLSYDMPEGYETAFGTFDVLLNTLFINTGMLENAPEWEALFYLYHELRHASQYIHPEKFSEEIQQSRFYVVLYDGHCFRLSKNEWRECVLEGPESYFEGAYLSLPYEKDANFYAYRKVREKVGDSSELKSLYAQNLPRCGFGKDDLKNIFSLIDDKTN